MVQSSASEDLAKDVLVLAKGPSNLCTRPPKVSTSAYNFRVRSLSFDKVIREKHKAAQKVSIKRGTEIEKPSSSTVDID